MNKDIQDYQQREAGNCKPAINITTATKAERLDYLVDMLKQLQMQANDCRADTLSYVIGLAVLEGNEQLNLCKYALDLEQEIFSERKFETAWKLKA